MAPWHGRSGLHRSLSQSPVHLPTTMTLRHLHSVRPHIIFCSHQLMIISLAVNERAASMAQPSAAQAPSALVRTFLGYNVYFNSLPAQASRPPLTELELQFIHHAICSGSLRVKDSTCIYVYFNMFVFDFSPFIALLQGCSKIW